MNRPTGKRAYKGTNKLKKTMFNIVKNAISKYDIKMRPKDIEKLEQYIEYYIDKIIGINEFVLSKIIVSANLSKDDKNKTLYQKLADSVATMIYDKQDKVENTINSLKNKQIFDQIFKSVEENSLCTARNILIYESVSIYKWFEPIIECEKTFEEIYSKISKDLLKDFWLALLLNYSDIKTSSDDMILEFIDGDKSTISPVIVRGNANNIQ